MLLAYDAKLGQVWTIEGNFGRTIEVAMRPPGSGWTVGHLAEEHIRQDLFEVASEAASTTFSSFSLEEQDPGSLHGGRKRGRESFSGNDLPHGKRLTRKRLPTPSARFHQEISGRGLGILFCRNSRFSSTEFFVPGGNCGSRGRLSGSWQIGSIRRQIRHRTEIIPPRIDHCLTAD
jgi:hypothetical protein